MHPSIVIIDIKLQWQANNKEDKEELNKEKTQLWAISQKTDVSIKKWLVEPTPAHVWALT